MVQEARAGTEACFMVANGGVDLPGGGIGEGSDNCFPTSDSHVLILCPFPFDSFCTVRNAYVML